MLFIMIALKRFNEVDYSQDVNFFRC